MRTSFLIGAVLGAALFSSEADAQTVPSESQCGAHAVLVDKLRERYAEVPVAMGLQSNGTVLEVFASRRANTWSVVITAPNGVSCLVSEGQSWETLPQLVDGPVS